MVGKNLLTINLPRTVSDSMSIQHGTELDYQIIADQLIVSVKQK